MDKKTKVKALLHYGGIVGCVEHVCEHNAEVRQILENIRYTLGDSDTKDFIEPYKVETEWEDDDMAKEFLSDGYTRSDIEYGDWDDAAEANIDTHAENVTSYIMELCFENDPDFYTATYNRVKREI